LIETEKTALITLRSNGKMMKEEAFIIIRHVSFIGITRYLIKVSI
jgi:hypothetical protein